MVLTAPSLVLPSVTPVSRCHRGRTFEVFRSSPPGSSSVFRRLDLPPHLRALSPLQSTHPERRAGSLQPPLLGFGFLPLHRHNHSASTPSRSAPSRAPFDLRSGATISRIPFRPRGFSPPRRLSPRHDLRACCIPLPILGFAAFRATSNRSRTRAPPRCASTLRRGPPPSAAPGHPGPCHLAVPSRSAGPFPVNNVAAVPASWTCRRERRLRGFAPTSGSYLDRCLAASTGPTLPWALSLHH